MNLSIIDMLSIAGQAAGEPYTNIPLTTVNDHVIRLSVMTEGIVTPIPTKPSRCWKAVFISIWNTDC